MVLEEKKVKNICNFYVSEYHLEIMLLPYISKKIDKGEEIIIVTENDLRKTLKVVIDKINLEQNKKEKIKALNWNNKKIEGIPKMSDIILVGSVKFITNIMNELKENNINFFKIIVCYNYNEVKDNMQNIVSRYDAMLNTLGINSI